MQTLSAITRLKLLVLPANCLPKVVPKFLWL